MNNTFLVGSTYFFKDIKDFKGKDIGRVVLVDNPIGFNFVRQTSGCGSCLFEWKRMSAEEFLKYTLKTQLPMSVGKFLVKEFCDEIGFTFEHLKQLAPIFEKLDKRHEYEKIIFDAYMENSEYKLTDKQLKQAYENYKKVRKQLWEEN